MASEKLRDPHLVGTKLYDLANSEHIVTPFFDIGMELDYRL